MNYEFDPSLKKYQQNPATWGANDPRHQQTNTHDLFREKLKAMHQPRVLEIGVKRSNPDRPTIHRGWAPHASSYIGVDLEDGLDVDVVADIHELSHHIAPNSIDALLCISVLEHVERPWVAACEIAKVLKPGGWVFCATHQTFPIHGFPKDYWRFTREALESLFSPEIGFADVTSFYAFPCDIRAEEANDTWQHFSFLHASVMARKERDPKEWVLR